jgi:predicted nucleic acid-binding protein
VRLSPGLASAGWQSTPRIFARPSHIEGTWGFEDALESRERAVRVDVHPMTYGIFKQLRLVSRAAGNRVPDAPIASLAIRHGATPVTADRAFAGFQGLACRCIEP